MKVVYSKSIMEQIKDISHTSLIEDRKIERIELTVGESRRLNEELNSIGWSNANRSISKPFVRGDVIFGINILST